MNTIHRFSNNNLDIKATIYWTVMELKKHAGYISIDQIQTAINNQLPEEEKLSRRMVVLIVADIVDMHKTGA